MTCASGSTTPVAHALAGRAERDLQQQIGPFERRPRVPGAFVLTALPVVLLALVWFAAGAPFRVTAQRLLDPTLAPPPWTVETLAISLSDQQPPIGTDVIVTLARPASMAHDEADVSSAPMVMLGGARVPVVPTPDGAVARFRAPPGPRVVRASWGAARSSGVLLQPVGVPVVSSLVVEVDGEAAGRFGPETRALGIAARPGARVEVSVLFAASPDRVTAGAGDISVHGRRARWVVRAFPGDTAVLRPWGPAPAESAGPRSMPMSPPITLRFLHADFASSAVDEQLAVDAIVVPADPVPEHAAASAASTGAVPGSLSEQQLVPAGGNETPAAGEPGSLTAGADLSDSGMVLPHADDDQEPRAEAGRSGGRVSSSSDQPPRESVFGPDLGHGRAPAHPQPSGTESNSSGVAKLDRLAGWQRDLIIRYREALREAAWLETDSTPLGAEPSEDPEEGTS